MQVKKLFLTYSENDRQLEEIVNLLTGLVNQRTDDSLAIQVISMYYLLVTTLPHHQKDKKCSQLGFTSVS